MAEVFLKCEMYALKNMPTMIYFRDKMITM